MKKWWLQWVLNISGLSVVLQWPLKYGFNCFQWFGHWNFLLLIFRVHSENTVTVTALQLKSFSVNPKNFRLVVANFSGQTTEKYNHYLVVIEKPLINHEYSKPTETTICSVGATDNN